MKILQVAPNISNKSDGVANCASALSKELISQHHDILVYAFKGLFKQPKGIPIKIFNVNQFPISSIGRSEEMLHSIMKINNIDIIHAHGLWMQPTYYAFKVAKKKSIKFCIQIHGTLSPWAINRSKIKKVLSLYLLGQRKALNNADLLIATCEDELIDIRNFGLKNPVAIIPNGVEIPEIIGTPTLNRKRLVFLSRIHPKKGIDILLKCWRNIQDEFIDWDLLIAGATNNEYANRILKLKDEIGCQRVEFVGELTGKAKFDFLSEASCFVLPTHSENFGIAVAESLAAGTPVITTTGAPWNEIESHTCGRWINLSEENLTSSLREMLSKSPQELYEMGQRGRQWMIEEFSWSRVAQMTEEAYNWMLSDFKSDKPEFINIL